MTLISILRSRLMQNASDATLISLRIELEDASDWLRSMNELPAGMRKAFIELASSLKNVEGDNQRIGM